MLETFLSGGSQRMATFVRPHRPQLVALLAVSLLCSGAESFIPLLLAPALSADRDVAALLFLGGAIALSVTANVWRHVITQRTKAGIALDLRVRLADQVALRARESAAEISPSGISTIASTDVDRFSNFPGLAVRFVASLCALVFVAVYLVIISPWIGVVVLVGVPAMMRLSSLLASPLEDRQEAHRDSLDAVATRSADLGEGLRVILGLRASQHFRRAFHRASMATRDAGLAAARLEALLLIVSQVVPGVLTLALVVLGVRFVQSGSLSAVDLVVFYAAAAYVVIPMQAFGNLLAGRGRSKASAKRIEGVMGGADDASHPVDSPIGRAAAAHPHVDEELQDPATSATVPSRGLAYFDTDKVASDEIARRLTGITPSSDVTVGQRLLSELATDERAATVRALFASPYLFAGSLRELLDPHGAATDEQISAALHVAAADDTVERLPGGLDEPVGSNARSFSGGERQRLALARTLLGDVRYLVLVEPTRALDTITSHTVSERLGHAREQLGTLVLTAPDHRDEQEAHND